MGAGGPSPARPQVPALPQVSSCPAGGLPLPRCGCPRCPAAGVPLPGRLTLAQGHVLTAAALFSLLSLKSCRLVGSELASSLVCYLPSTDDCRLERHHLSSLLFDVLRAAFSNFLMLDGRLMNVQPFFFPNTSYWGGAFPFMNQFSCVLPVLKLHF